MIAGVAAHADWSVDPRKRWISVADRDGGGWSLTAPAPVGEVGTLLARLHARAAGAPVALGVDLPLGLPRAYAAAHRGEASFPAFLAALRASDPWFEVCEALEDISPGRPFYPRRALAGMRRDLHAQAMGFERAGDLSRLCDRATAERPAGAALFWTVGANQSGRAALSAWRDLLLPAWAAGSPPRVWPFEGDLLSLLAPGRIVIAETYPAEAARQLGLRVPGSKQRQEDRAALAAGLAATMRILRADPDDALRDAMREGFGPRHGRDDGFDSVLGVLCVLAVLAGSRPDGVPEALGADPWIRAWEGWLLGQTALPLTPASR